MNILNWITSRSCYLFPLVVFLLFVAVLGREAIASDLEREKRMAAEIVDAILDGDPVMLEADGIEFLSIYTEAMEDPVKGNVIILHGRGYHPDWAEVANPLRVGLAVTATAQIAIAALAERWWMLAVGLVLAGVALANSRTPPPAS